MCLQNVLDSETQADGGLDPSEALRHVRSVLYLVGRSMETLLTMVRLTVTGAELKLPEGYQCHIVQKQQLQLSEQQQQQQQAGSQASEPWTGTVQAASLTHWKHDMLPSKTDDLPRCCEWIMLSEQVRPMSSAEWLPVMQTPSGTISGMSWAKLQGRDAIPACGR